VDTTDEEDKSSEDERPRKRFVAKRKRNEDGHGIGHGDEDGEDDDDDDDDDDNEFEVEKIVMKRVTEEGVTEYRIKWAGYERRHNTWQVAADLHEELVQDFEEAMLRKSQRKRRRYLAPKSGDTPSRNRGRSPQKARRSVSGVRGGVPSRDTVDMNKAQELREKGVEPQDILGVHDNGHQLFLLLKWADSREPLFVPKSEVTQKWPQCLIRFFEDRLSFPSQ
jgi:hypothetical protein